MNVIKKKKEIIKYLEDQIRELKLDVDELQEKINDIDHEITNTEQKPFGFNAPRATSEVASPEFDSNTKYAIRDSKVLARAAEQDMSIRTIRIMYKGENRCAMSISDLAECFAKTARHPRKLAGQHARKYARNKNNNFEWVEGVHHSSDRTTFMVLEVFEEHVLNHFMYREELPPL